jgi:hypothetical protein
LPLQDPLPGARHDAYCFKEHGLEKYLDETTLADKGYVGLGLLTPAKRKSGVKMLTAVQNINRVINKLPAVVEPVIAQVKSWCILPSGFRCSLGCLWAGVFFWCVGWCFWLLVTPYE